MKPLAITMGDGAGIGPEIIAKAWLSEPAQLAGCFVVGDMATLRRAAEVAARFLQVPALPLALIDSPAEAVAAPPRCMPVLHRPGLPQPPEWGRVQGESGRFAGDCVWWAAQAALRGEVAGLVTAPLHKEAMSAGGMPYAQYPGHTEMFQTAAAQYSGVSIDEMPVRMMLANDELRVVLVSIHVSLREAIERVTFAAVSETIRITADSLRRMLGRAPRLLVAGLNPHAGEGGLFGDEELRVIGPAIDAARAAGIDARGPLAPDTVFMHARQSQATAEPVDAVIAMYHDQGLIPVKYLGVEEGVNVTLGLPLVRTSPDHGTAFDIAGTGRASQASLLQAIRVARQLVAAPNP